MIDVSPLFAVAPMHRFTLIAGPCVLEIPEIHDRIAETLSLIHERYRIPVIFKASFDKANRTSWESPRGPGLEEGVDLLAQIKEDWGLPILTDIHQPYQAVHAAKVCDVLQIPAALCRQTDLLWAAAATGKPVNLKKGQWVGVPEMVGAVKKMYAGQAGEDYPVSVTERGTFFGYGNLVVDNRNIVQLRDQLGIPVFIDGTHTVQRPGTYHYAADRPTRILSDGDRSMIRPLVLAGIAAGADGLYIEVHPDPDLAPSDAASMLPLHELGPLVRQCLRVRQALGHYEDGSHYGPDDTCVQCGESKTDAARFGCVVGFNDCLHEKVNEEATA